MCQLRNEFAACKCLPSVFQLTSVVVCDLLPSACPKVGDGPIGFVGKLSEVFFVFVVYKYVCWCCVRMALNMRPCDNSPWHKRDGKGKEQTSL